jgi:hypothetical protein
MLSQMGHDILYLDKYWFIMSTFMTGIIYHGIHRVVISMNLTIDERKLNICIILIALAIVTVTNGTNYPFLFGQNAMAIIFWSLGNLLSPVADCFENWNPKHVIVSTLMGTVVMCTGVLLNYKFCNGANFYHAFNVYGNIVFALLGAVGGVILWGGRFVFYLQQMDWKDSNEMVWS